MCALLFIIAVVSAGVRVFWSKRERPRFTDLTWTNSMRVPLPLRETMRVGRAHLVDVGRCRVLHQDRRQQVFARGDWQVTELPFNRDVTWPEVPVFIEVGYGVESGDTVVEVSIRAKDGVVFDGPCAEMFRKGAQREFEALFAQVDAHSRAYHARRETEGAADGTIAHRSAYAALDLKPGATWADIQAAYRGACKRYHPDALAGQRVPPHLVELAVRRFREVTAAYQTLKGQCPQ